MKSLKSILMAGAVLMASVAGVAALGGEVYAANKCPNDPKLTYEHSVAECGVAAVQDPNKKEDDLMTTVKTIINVVLSVVGILAVAVIIIGGIFFILSQGDAAKVTRARNTILYGVVGLVVALLAFAIVNFVLSTFFASGK